MLDDVFEKLNRSDAPRPGLAVDPGGERVILEPRSSIYDSARPLTLLLRKRGLSQESLEEVTGLRRAHLDDAGRRIGRGAVNRLWALAREVPDDPAIGLRLERLAPQHMHLVCHLAKRTQTVREMFETWRTYAPLICDAEALEIRARIGGILVTHRLLSPLYEDRSASEYALVHLLSRVREFTGRAAEIREVRFRHGDPGYANLYRSVFGCPVRFGAEENALLFDPAVLDLPLRTRDPYLHQILSDHAGVLLAQDRQPVVEVWRRIVGAILQGEDCSLKEVASHLHTSERTLNRVLMREGVSYRRLLDAARRDLALSEVRRGHSVRQICEHLRFSEPATLSRAFVRWFGVPISEYRQVFAAGGA